MKILQSPSINAFGGVNFVLEALDDLGLEALLTSTLPALSPNACYSWKDIFYSFSSIFYCGGQCAEDTKTVLLNQFGENPFFKLCSPDTLLRRLKALASEDRTCTTPRGKVTHTFNNNELLARLNIKLLQSLGEFNTPATILDYDNTIVFNEKKDSKMTYKRAYGYQPGVCLLNGKQVVFIENRNGNSDAKSFQSNTLKRMFDLLDQAGVGKVNQFRADAASYQYKVIQLLQQHVNLFYIGTKAEYVEKYYAQINHWEKAKDNIGEDIQIGHIKFQPFVKHYKDAKQPTKYRLLVKRKLRKDTQMNILTGDAYDYHSVITNDFSSDTKEALMFYYQRGAAERQFDVLKNDFGWNHMPFSKLSQNNVFFYFTALCHNLYKVIIERLSQKFNNVKPNYRMKRLIFQFIATPAKWVKKARQQYLRIYGNISFKT